MQFRPILSAMLRSKTGPILIALQIAITLAIVTNALFIINQRTDKMNRPTGMDTDRVIFATSVGFGTAYDHMATMRDDLNALRGIPGVADAAFINRIPLSGGGSSTVYYADPDVENGISQLVNTYGGDERTSDVLGLKMAEGRWFRAEDIQSRSDEDFSRRNVPVIITKAYAEDLFDGESAVDRQVYDSQGRPNRIIGVIEHMQGAWVSWDRIDRTLFYGEINEPPALQYAIRAESPDEVESLIAAIEAKLQEINRDRVVLNVRAHSDYIERSYAGDSAMIRMLGAVSVLLIAVTALGIVGLAAFNVNQRRKQIGTRRALGATQPDILRYFLTESLMIAGIGIGLGTALAFSMSWWLGTEFGLPELDWRYLPPAMISLLVIAALAVFGPARRASMISPALATRSV